MESQDEFDELFSLDCLIDRINGRRKSTIENVSALSAYVLAPRSQGSSYYNLVR